MRQHHKSKKRVRDRQTMGAPDATDRQWVMRLEDRRLLSAVVSVYPIPNAQTSDWYNGASHIVAGPNGNFWFTDPTDNAIGEVTPAGQVSEFPLPAIDSTSADAGDSQTPTDIIVGPDNNLWFTENGVDAIGRITPGGTITEFHTPTADSNPLGLAIGADGKIWFLEAGVNRVANISTDGKITEFALGDSTLTGDDAIAEGPDGKIWFAAYDANDNNILAAISPSGVIGSHPIDDDPTAIAAGPDGNLWVGTDSGNIDKVTADGTVTAFAIPDGADINTIAAGTDGKLWFTTDGNNQFGSIATSGAISEYTLPGNDADVSSSISPADIIQAAGGTLWFTDADNAQVGTIDLTDALIATSASATVTAGSASSAALASFVDFAGGTDPSAYTATITFADNSTLPGTITANAAGGFDVSASADWALGQGGAVTVSITDNADATRVATAYSQLTVNAPAAVGTAMHVSATSGQAFSGTVASFSNVAANSFSSYSATIDWGDGHETAGTISLNNAGGFDVAGSNTYAQSGSYTVTTTLSPFGAFHGFLPVAPIAVVNPGGPIVSPVVGAVITTHALPGSAKGVTVHSGATSSLAGSSGSSSGANGVAISTPISIGGGDGQATAAGAATVAAGVMDGTGYSVQASSSTPFSGDVASFVLADPSADASGFQATITWSDPGVQDWATNSTPPSAGAISSDGKGNLTVSTSANFTQSGLFHFVVTITDGSLGSGAGATVGVAYGQVIVDTPYPYFVTEYAAGAPVLTAGAISNAAGVSTDTDPVLSEKVKAVVDDVKSTAGKTFKGDIGKLVGVYSTSKTPAELQGTINWGDGTTSAATFAGAGKGKVAVRGSHQYAASGQYPISVTMTQELSSGGKLIELTPLLLPTISSTANIVASPTHASRTTANAGNYTASVGVAFTSLDATVTLPAAATGDIRTVSIGWGDGANSTGSLTSLGGDNFSIGGVHTYRKAGTYAIRISVLDKIGKTTNLAARLKGVVKVSDA